MSYNKSPLAFDDVRDALDKAVNSEKGIKLRCESRGAAVVLRSRFNYYRKINREENKKIYESSHPMWGKSVYDRLLLRIPRKGDPEENYLFIEKYSLTTLNIELIDD